MPIGHLRSVIGRLRAFRSAIRPRYHNRTHERTVPRLRQLYPRRVCRYISRPADFSLSLFLSLCLSRRRRRRRLAVRSCCATTEQRAYFGHVESFRGLGRRSVCRYAGHKRRNGKEGEREREREGEKKRGRTRASEQRRRKCWLARSGAKRLPEREKGGKSAWSPGFYRLRKCQTPVE